MIYRDVYIIPFKIGMKTTANFSDAVKTSIPAITFRDRVPYGTASDPLSSEITLIYNEQQRYKFGNTSLQSNVTGDELNSMTRPRSVHNYTPIHQTTNSQKPTEHINITPERSISNYQAALSNSGQHDVNDVNTGSSLGNKIASSKNIDDRAVNFSQVDQRVNYSDTSKRTQVNNFSYNEHMDLGGTENKIKRITTSNDKREEATTEVQNFKHGLQYTSIIDEDNVASETENTYNVAGYVNKKPTQDNVEIINSGRDVFLNNEDHVYMSMQDEEMDAFPSNYNTETGQQTSSYESPRALYRPFSQPSRPAISPYRPIPPRPLHVLADTDPHGSATSYYSLSFNSPYKSPSTLYIPKPTDSFGSASVPYSSVASGPYRLPTASYDSPPQKMPSALYSSPSRKPPSAPHVSPSRKPPSILHGSPPRKPLTAPHESPPYKLSPSYNSASIELHQSSSTLHYSPLSPSYGSAPQKTSKPSYYTQDPHGSLTSAYSSLPHGSRPPSISGSSRPPYSSPPKKSSIPSYNFPSGDLYESPTSPHSSLPHDSRPPISSSSPSHKSHRPSYGSPQNLPGPSQSSELYESPVSSHSSSSHDTRPHKSDSSTHVSHKPSYGSPLKISPRPSSESQSSELYESPTSPYSSTRDSRPPSISGSPSYRPSRPLHGSPPKMSHRPSYVSESTDSYESPSSSKGSSPRGSRPPSISESLSSHKPPTPSHGSPPKNSHRPLYDSESTDS
jgi:hypothetical protein